MGKQKSIAEDLGYLTDTVVKLVKDTNDPGMKVLQFAIESREESDYLTHNYIKNCVVYTGTHDNNTIVGWFDSMNDHDKAFALQYLGVSHLNKKELSKAFVRLAHASVADICMIPIQDYLAFGAEARINEPSTVGKNWRWRLKTGDISDTTLNEMKQICRTYGRR